MLVDIDSNGRKDLVFGNERLGQMAWFSSSVKAKKVTWTRTPVSEQNAKGVGLFSHGLGWGDINGDGIKDVMIRGGWWEAPKEMKTSPWKFHEADLGESCAQMLTFDFDNDINQDGLPDLITGKRFFSHQGKGPGGLEPAVLYWFELLKDGKQKPVWVRHLIDDNSGVGIQFVTEDMNKDGKPDIVISNKNGVFYFEQQ